MTKFPQHLIDIKQLNAEQIHSILKRAQALIETKDHLSPKNQNLSGITLSNLFFENSTRTLSSFALAAKRQGADVLNLPISQSSIQKGEALIDTVLTLEALGTRLFAIRLADHQALLDCLPYTKSNVHIINAGSGTIAHPTQALIDLLTIQQENKLNPKLKIAIIGDILHSRVAKSQIQALKTLGINEIRLCGPEDLIPPQNEIDCDHYPNIDEAIQDADVIALLRIQLERMPPERRPSLSEYKTRYALNEKNLATAKKSAIILHPGPINRDLEITSALAYCPQSRILKQVENGLAIRMAVMQILIENTL